MGAKKNNERITTPGKSIISVLHFSEVMLAKYALLSGVTEAVKHLQKDGNILS